MSKYNKLNKNSGFIFLELVIAIGLIGIVFVVLLDIGASVLKISNSMQKESKADFLIKEEFEALRSFRDATSWDTGLKVVNTGAGNFYHLINSSGSWTLVSGVETVGGIFSRKIVFGDAYRDGDGNLTSSVVNSEPDAKKITITVSWENKTMQTVSYLTNWKQ